MCTSGGGNWPRSAAYSAALARSRAACSSRRLALSASFSDDTGRFSGLCAFLACFGTSMRLPLPPG